MNGVGEDLLSGVIPNFFSMGDTMQEAVFDPGHIISPVQARRASLGLMGMIDPGIRKPPSASKAQQIVQSFDRLRPDALKNTKVRLGRHGWVDDLLWKKEPGPWHSRIGGRHFQNPKASALEKILTLPSTAVGIPLSRLGNAPHYNPTTDAVFAPLNSEPILQHELGHAIDFNQRGKASRLANLLLYATPLPRAQIPMERAANRESEKVVRELHKNNSKALVGALKARAKVLTPAYASYQNLFPGPLKALTMPVSIYRGKRQGEKIAASLKKPSDPTGPWNLSGTESMSESNGIVEALDSVLSGQSADSALATLSEGFWKDRKVRKLTMQLDLTRDELKRLQKANKDFPSSDEDTEKTKWLTKHYPEIASHNLITSGDRLKAAGIRGAVTGTGIGVGSLVAHAALGLPYLPGSIWPSFMAGMIASGHYLRHRGDKALQRVLQGQGAKHELDKLAFQSPMIHRQSQDAQSLHRANLNQLRLRLGKLT